jgi:hypothetical protein
VKLGAGGQHQTEPHRGALVDEQAQQLQRGRIHPVQVFYHQEDRLAPGFGVQPGQQDVKSALALPLRGQCQRGIGRGQRERHQGGQQRHGLGQRQARRSQGGF